MAHAFEYHRERSLRKGMDCMVEPTNRPPLSATRITFGGACCQGGRMTHVISIVNSGSKQYTGLRVEDALGFCETDGKKTSLRSYAADTAEYYVNGVLQAPPAVVGGPPLAVLGLTVPAGGNVTVLYQTEIHGSSHIPAGVKMNDSVRVFGAGEVIRVVDIRRGQEYLTG